jgi:hypothetical protein
VVLVVDERLAEELPAVVACPRRRAHERLLVLTGEDRPLDRMVHDLEVGRVGPAGRVAVRAHRELVGSELESADESLERATVGRRREGRRHILAVARHRHLLERDGAGHVDAHECVAPADLVRAARQHREHELLAGRWLGLAGGGRSGSGERHDHRDGDQRP